MSCGGGGTNTVVQNQKPPPQVLQAYQNLTNAAFGQAGQPLAQYAGPLVAGFTPQQTQAFSEIQNAQGLSQPYINAAAQEFGQATTPFYQTVGQYTSPYTGAVTNALQGLFNQQNAQQLQQVQGNATAAGAYGGDREAVAQALTAQQQNLSEAPTLANVLQGGYQTALGAAEAQGYLGQQAGFGLGNLGTEAQQNALAGASAELQAGAQQQQLAQEQLNIPYEQFQSAQAYPWQVLDELSPIVSGIGSLSGGSGSTTYPGPSLVSQIGGLGIAGLGTYGLLNSTGALSGLGSLFGGGSAAGDALAATFAGPAAFTADSGALAALGGPFAAAGLAKGGRIGYQDGGGIGAPSEGAMSSVLPSVPNINLDYLAHPGPVVKGSGPPRAPEGNPTQFQGQTPIQELEMFGGLNKLVDQTGIGNGSARGGHLQTGGQPGGGIGSESLAGLPPQLQGYVQQLQSMPIDQLQNLALRVSANPTYGPLVQKVLSLRRTSPGNITNAVSSASGVPIGTGIGQVPQAGGIGSDQQQQPIGAAQGQAEGGRSVIQDEPDMDPHPEVDHSGETVVVHYPSEGKDLDLGIPSSPGQRRRLAAGGVGGIGSPTTFATGAVPFVRSVTAPNGIQIPQISQDLFAPPAATGFAPTAGGGLGNWFDPLPQFSQGPLGTFPAVTPTTPGILALEQSFEAGGRTRLQDGGNPGVPGVTISPDSPFATDPPEGAPVAVIGPAPASTAGSPPPAPAPGPPDSHAQAQPSAAPPPSATPDLNTPQAREAITQNKPTEGDIGKPAGGIGAAPSAKPGQQKADPLAPVMDRIASGESHGDYNARYGFPDLPGAPGPQGVSHALGKYQFEPGTWKQASDAVVAAGQPKPDFNNPADQDRVARFWAIKTYRTDANGRNLTQAAQAGDVDYHRLAAQWPSLAPHPPTAGGGRGDQIVGPGRGGFDVGNIGTGYAAGIGEPFTGIGGAGVTVPNIPVQTPESAKWSQSPWLIPIAIGAGIMSGRSSHPLVNVGEGLMAGVKTAEQQGEQGTRQAALENEAANRQATLGIEAQRLGQQGQYQAGELAMRQNEFQRQMKAEQDRFSVEIANAKTAEQRADVLSKHYENIDAMMAAVHQAAIAKPIPSFEVDPQTGKITYGARVYNLETNQYDFQPGIGVGRAPTAGNAGAFTAKQQAWLAIPGHEHDLEGAALFAAGKSQMTPEQKSLAALRLAQTRLSTDIPAMALPPEQQTERLREYQAEALRDINSGAGAAAPAAPAVPATAPTAGARPTAQAAPPIGTQENPLVPRTQADIDNAPPGTVIKTPQGLMMKPQPQQQPAP